MIIVPCCGVCNLGRLSVDAARSLMQDEKHQFMAATEIAATRTLPDSSSDFFTIDGCKKECATAILRNQGQKERWSLTISELGIAFQEDGDYLKDDLLLVRDGIEATLAVVGDKIPRSLGSCGCC